jgi:hypothetical protein
MDKQGGLEAADGSHLPIACWGLVHVAGDGDGEVHVALAMRMEACVAGDGDGLFADALICGGCVIIAS